MMGGANVADVFNTGFDARLEAVFRKAARLLPGDLGHHLLALVSPESLAIMAGVIAIWAASHFAGVGEIADVALLIGGWLTIGASAIAGCRKLLSFASATRSARTEADLDRAAGDLADAITILGVDVALGLLFRGRPKGIFSHSYKGPLPPMRQAMRVMPRAGPMSRYEFQVSYTRGLEIGKGGTNPLTNVARIGRDWLPGSGSLSASVRGVRQAAHHEVVHLWLNRTFSMFGRPTLYTRLGAYKRSFMLRYLEEAVAEARSQRHVPRRANEPEWYRFPFNPTYEVTLRQIGQEATGIFLGPVVVGGSTYHAYHGFAHDHN